jgi:hypothetical protein
MLSIKDLERSLFEQESSSEEKLGFSNEQLEKTARYLTALASPDREIDKLAKLAVLLDYGLEKEAGLFGLNRKMRGLEKSHKVVMRGT